MGRSAVQQFAAGLHEGGNTWVSWGQGLDLGVERPSLASFASVNGGSTQGPIWPPTSTGPIPPTGGDVQQITPRPLMPGGVSSLASGASSFDDGRGAVRAGAVVKSQHSIGLGFMGRGEGVLGQQQATGLDFIGAGTGFGLSQASGLGLMGAGRGLNQPQASGPDARGAGAGFGPQLGSGTSSRSGQEGGRLLQQAPGIDAGLTGKGHAMMAGGLLGSRSRSSGSVAHLLRSIPLVGRGSRGEAAPKLGNMLPCYQHSLYKVGGGLGRPLLR